MWQQRRHKRQHVTACTTACLLHTDMFAGPLQQANNTSPNYTFAQMSTWHMYQAQGNASVYPTAAAMRFHMLLWTHAYL